MRKPFFVGLLFLVIFISGCVERPMEKPAGYNETSMAEPAENEEAWLPPEEKPAESQFPGFAPGNLGLAITSDGRTAYITFASDDSLLAVDLSTFTVTDSIDVSAAGNMLLSTAAVLSPDGKKLYVSNYGTRNVMVVDTENKRVEKVLPIEPLYSTAITMSRDGSKAYIPSDANGLYIVNTSDYSYRNISIPGMIFGPVAPSLSNPDLLYAAGTLLTPPGTEEEIFHPSFFTFNVTSNVIVRSSRLPEQIMPPRALARRLVVNSNETLAYFNWFDTASGDKGAGNFNIFNLGSFKVQASTPIENGVADFAVNEKTGKAYIAGFWAGGGAPGKLSILEYNIPTNEVVRQIPVSPSSDQRAIAIDPANANYLYMTEGDFNFIRKVDITTGKEIAKVQFNKADVRPYAIIRGDNNTGYIFSQSSRKVYRLDLNSGQLIGSIEMPFSFAGWGFYQGKLYFGSGNSIYVVKPSNGKIIKEYRIGNNFNPKIFTFFGDKMATIDFEVGSMVGRRLLFFDIKDMSIIKSIDLPREPHGDKVIVSPDGSKLYIERGQMMGTAVITVFNASTLGIINTIEIPVVPQRRGATGFVEADFDETNRSLYLAGFMSIYKINMDTDKLIDILDLIDVYESQNIRGWSPSGLCGVALSSSKDKLLVVSGDAHSMYAYDLTKSSWTTKIANLKGYFITDAANSPDRRYLYTVNQESDSITMVDLTSGDVVKIIPLT